MSRRSLVALGLALVAGGAFALTGCTNEESGSSSAGTSTVAVEVTKVDEIAAKLPQRIRDAGKLVIGVNVPYAPNEFKNDSGQIVGFDVDLMTAVSQVFGVEPVFTEAEFDKIIPAIQAGTYDMGMSSFTDTKEREQTVDFTTYFSAGVQWAQRPDNPIDPNNACGKRVAVQATTIEDTEEVPAKSAACVEAGQPPIEIVKFDRQDDATTALVLGNVDAMSADSPVTAYAIKQSGGKIEATGQIFDAAPYGWPVVKGSELAPALQAAMQHLIDDGTYATIAENWGVQEGMITESQINAAVN